MPHFDTEEPERPPAGKAGSGPRDEAPEEPLAPPGGAGAEEPGQGARPAAVKEDPDAVLVHRNTPVPSVAELRSALQWAFQDEDIEPSVLDRFAQHAHMVLQGNRRMNLTAIVEPREVAAKHYLDSWRATRLLPLMGKRMLDLGSGAGFPGMPIALAESHAHVTLLDSMKKRADFLGECLAQLEVKNATNVWARGEEHLARNKYDIVLVRALSSVRENVRLLRKVRHSHKDLVLLKGPSWSREVRAGEREAERLGFKLDTVWEHKLPGELGERAILVYRAPGSQGER